MHEANRYRLSAEILAHVVTLQLTITVVIILIGVPIIFSINRTGSSYFVTVSKQQPAAQMNIKHVFFTVTLIILLFILIVTPLQNVLMIYIIMQYYYYESTQNIYNRLHVDELQHC